MQLDGARACRGTSAAQAWRTVTTASQWPRLEAARRERCRPVAGLNSTPSILADQEVTVRSGKSTDLASTRALSHMHTMRELLASHLGPRW